MYTKEPIEFSVWMIKKEVRKSQSFSVRLYELNWGIYWPTTNIDPDSGVGLYQCRFQIIYNHHSLLITLFLVWRLSFYNEWRWQWRQTSNKLHLWFTFSKARTLYIHKRVGSYIYIYINKIKYKNCLYAAVTRTRSHNRTNNLNGTIVLHRKKQSLQTKWFGHFDAIELKI